MSPRRAVALPVCVLALAGCASGGGPQARQDLPYHGGAPWCEGEIRSAAVPPTTSRQTPEQARYAHAAEAALLSPDCRRALREAERAQAVQPELERMPHPHPVPVPVPR